MIAHPRTLENPFISVVTPILNERSLVHTLIESLSVSLSALTDRFEIIVVDDGSQDGTSEQVKQMIGRYPVKLVRFSRNFGKENALTAGLAYASGDAVLIIDSDLQHPLETVALFFEKWKEGYDNVYGICRRTSKDQGLLYRSFTKVFYKMNRHLMDIDLPPNAGDFRFLDRCVVDAINQLPEHNRFMKGLYAWVGFKGIGIPYVNKPRGGGKSRFNFIRLFRLAVTGITSFSNFPLRIWSMIGALISFCSLIYGLFVLVNTLLYGNAVSGWATLAVGMLFLGGVQLISIGVLAEYIARIFNEVKRRPNYLVAETLGFEAQKERKECPSDN